MPFVKLDCGILDSSLWIDHDARTLFVTALLMAKPYTLDDPATALDIRKIEPSGFIVPPGEYGFVEAASTGIIQRAGVPRERGTEALCRLCETDAESRTPDNEGRRMARVDGGFLILNYAKYREQDRTNAERQKRFRNRHKPDAKPPRVKPHTVSNGVTAVTGPLLITQAEAEADKDISLLPKGNNSPGPQAGPGRVLKGAKVVELFHSTCPTLPKVLKLTESRKAAVGNRAKHATGDPLEWFAELFKKAHASDFLSGRNGQFAGCSFDWLIKPANAQKTLEGNYDNDRREKAQDTDSPDADKYDGWTGRDADA